MFEHLDDVLQPANPLDDPEYAAIRARTVRARKRRTALATTVTVSVLATGGVSGLALNGPATSHAPVAGGPLLAIGTPRTPLPIDDTVLTAGERTRPSECPRVLTPASTTTGRSRSNPVVVLPGGARLTPGPAFVVGGGGAPTGAPRKIFVGVAPSEKPSPSGGGSPSGESRGSGGTGGTGPVVVVPSSPPVTGDGGVVAVPTTPSPPTENPPDPAGGGDGSGDPGGPGGNGDAETGGGEGGGTPPTDPSTDPPPDPLPGLLEAAVA